MSNIWHVYLLVSLWSVMIFWWCWNAMTQQAAENSSLQQNEDNALVQMGSVREKHITTWVHCHSLWHLLFLFVPHTHINVTDEFCLSHTLMKTDGDGHFITDSTMHSHNVSSKSAYFKEDWVCRHFCIVWSQKQHEHVLTSNYNL